MLQLKLLVVEDDAASLELMTEVFESLKADVRPVSDSEEAARRVNQEKFDGIFLDLEMPRLHGFDLARWIRKSSWNKSTPIIIVTGQDQRESMQEAFAVGATFFLQKPIDRQKLNKLFRSVRGGMLENRRRYTRVPLQTTVTCAVGSRTLNGVSWNLSQGGMAVEVEHFAAERCGAAFISPTYFRPVDRSSWNGGVGQRKAAGHPVHERGHPESGVYSPIHLRSGRNRRIVRRHDTLANRR